MALKTLNRRNKKDLKWPKIIIAILSTIGIVDTGSITLKNWGLFTSLSCPGIQNGCETVLNSPWGTLFENNQVNIPLSLAGFITYLSILVITIVLSLNLISPKEKLNKFLWWLVFLISCASSTFSFLLINIMFFKIQAYCFFCILSAILSFSIPGHESEVNNPQFFKVIEPVSTMPIVLRIAIMIFGHFKSFLFLLFKVSRAIKNKVCYLHYLS